MSDKKRLIKHLKNDIYCRLGVSKISGIGVMAIKDIPKGVDPFKTLSKYNKEIDNIITLNKKDVKNLDENVVKILHDFFGSEKRKQYDVLASGPNNINISFYMNHSDDQNIDIYDDPSSEYFSFVSNRLIKKGEELTINYSKFEDDDDDE
jgi:SET domain-containing protein